MIYGVAICVRMKTMNLCVAQRRLRIFEMPENFSIAIFIYKMYLHTHTPKVKKVEINLPLNWNVVVQRMFAEYFLSKEILMFGHYLPASRLSIYHSNNTTLADSSSSSSSNDGCWVGVGGGVAGRYLCAWQVMYDIIRIIQKQQKKQQQKVPIYMNFSRRCRCRSVVVSCECVFFADFNSTSSSVFYARIKPVVEIFCCAYHINSKMYSLSLSLAGAGEWTAFKTLECMRDLTWNRRTKLISQHENFYNIFCCCFWIELNRNGFKV